MRVFISSVISGLEECREAAAQAARTLRHEVTRSEDFEATASTPQQACLAGVRQADAIVLLLGERYGGELESGLSATHEEYREARGNRPVLAFVQEGIEAESRQAEFIAEVRSWESGSFTGSFATPLDLRDAVTRSLHELELSARDGEADEAEMLKRAEALVPQALGHTRASLALVVTGGPRQTVLRPAQLADPLLEKDVLRESLTGDFSVLSTAEGTETRQEETRLTLEQEGASVLIDALGSVRVIQPAADNDGFGLPALIEEDIHARIQRALRLAAATLDRIDPVHRVGTVLPMLALNGATYMGWRTREEHARSPQSMTMSMSASDPEIVTLSPFTRPRTALTHDAESMAEDFVSVLRSRLSSR